MELSSPSFFVNSACLWILTIREELRNRYIYIYISYFHPIFNQIKLNFNGLVLGLWSNLTQTYMNIGLTWRQTNRLTHEQWWKHNLLAEVMTKLLYPDWKVTFHFSNEFRQIFSPTSKCFSFPDVWSIFSHP